MPESEPKPKLIELVGPGAGQGWKAVLRNGKPAVVHEIPVPPAEATAAVPRLQRLYEHRHPALSPVLAWGTDQSGVWVAVEPNEGTPLGSILSRGPLTPPAAAAIGAAVLSGVAALHEAGIALGGFGATAVRVTTNGDIRLAGHPAAAVRAAPSQSDLRADVRSCGMAVCAAFGVDPAGAPAPPNISPGLVVTMRSMASGALRPSPAGARRTGDACSLRPDVVGRTATPLRSRGAGGEGDQPARATNLDTDRSSAAGSSRTVQGSGARSPQTRTDFRDGRAGFALCHVPPHRATTGRGSRPVCAAGAADLDARRGPRLEAGRDSPGGASWHGCGRGRDPAQSSDSGAHPARTHRGARAQAVCGAPAIQKRSAV